MVEKEWVRWLNRFHIIDADAHVIETERTWDYLDDSDRKYRPQALIPRPTTRRASIGSLEDKIAGFRFLTLSERELREFADRAGRNFATPQAARELDDVDLRLEAHGRIGHRRPGAAQHLLDRTMTTNRQAEVAVCRSWNRWLADISQEKPWPVILFLRRARDRTSTQPSRRSKFAKENGGAAVCMRPLEGDRHLSDPYFYPIYQTASDLDLSIAVHIANGNPANADLYRLAPAGRFAQFRVPTVTACFDVIMSELHQSISQTALGIHRSVGAMGAVDRPRRQRSATAPKDELFPQNVFEEYNIYVTCQTNDDVPYMVSCCGEDRLVIGTDYGHTDPSSAVTALNEFQRMEGLDASG